MSCTCDACVKYCTWRPGWPTPEEAARLIELGHGDQFMIDWWEGGGRNGVDILILSPAQVGYEGGCADENPPKVPCVFLVDRLCSIHHSKPMECRESHHTGTDPGLHYRVAMTWNTDEGRSLVAAWRGDA